jgi:DNA-binding NarL/FixJ family response regulator
MVDRDGPGSVGTISVLIVADVRLYREGLAASLASRQPRFAISTSASRGEARAWVRSVGADVVVVDVATRESLELICDLRREAASAQILAFAVDEVASEVIDCAEAGAAGYVAADASLDELVTAIERIARDELVCSPRVAARLFRRISQKAEPSVLGSTGKVLTGRERQVLDFIQKGHSNKEIAQRLNIAEPTVKNHVHHVLEKMEVATRAQAAARAVLPSGRRRPFEPALT